MNKSLITNLVALALVLVGFLFEQDRKSVV